MSLKDVLFYVFAGITCLAALRVVTAKNPIAGAFSLILVLFGVAAEFAILDAHFLAALQIFVYAGAVMVLFVFVIMLLNADVHDSDMGKSPVFQISAGVLTFAVFLLVAWTLIGTMGRGVSFIPTALERGTFTIERIEELGGNVRVLSEVMFSDHVLPFELTSVLLLVGIIGSVALAKRARRQKA